MDIKANPALDAIIDAALAEDLGHGDPTTHTTVAPNAQAVGRAVSRQKCVVAGATVFERVFNKVDPYVSVNVKVPDGTGVEPGEEIAVVAGKASSILAAERVALNFLQHMSGVATLARAYVKKVPEGSKTRIDKLTINNATSNTTAQLKCKGSGCPFKSKKAKKAKRGKINLLGLFGKKRTLRAGATLDVLIMRPNIIGKVVRYQIRNNKSVKRSELCLRPGSTKPRSSCS